MNTYAESIVYRLLKTSATTRNLGEEYGLYRDAIEAVYRERTTAAQRMEARYRKYSATRRGRKSVTNEQWACGL